MAKKRRQSLLYETELSWFILISSLDVFMTYIILRYSAEGRTQNVMYESNPVAHWVLMHWGIRGMVIFKFVMIALISAIAEIVGRVHPNAGRSLLLLGTVVVGVVVIYSFQLLRNNL